MSEFRRHQLTKKVDEYRVMASYDGGETWDVENYEDNVRDANRSLREYQENGGGMYQWKKARIPNPDYDRFKVGTRVKVHPATDAFMAGFRYGEVVQVGTLYVRVSWSMDPEVKRRFRPENIAPAQ